MDVGARDPERHGGAIRRRPGGGGRGRRRLLVLFVAAQSLLMAVCVAVSFYSLWTPPQEKKIPSIYLQVIETSNLKSSDPLTLDPRWSVGIQLQKKGIQFPCSGPYVLFLATHLKTGSSVELTVWGNGFNLSVPIVTTGSWTNYTGIQNFSKGQTVFLALRFPSASSVNLKDLHVALQYLVGNDKLCIE